MNLRYKKIAVFVLAGVVYLAGQYFRGVWFQNFFINPCRNSIDNWGVFCNSPYVETFGFPLIALGQMLAIVAVILLLANTDTFRKWLKFSAYYIPIAVVLAYWIYPIRFPPGPVVPISQGVYPFGWLYVVITLGIVLWGLYTSRRSTN